jgi:cytidine deaminase
LEYLKRYSSVKELSQEDHDLLMQAIQSRELAYAPYSHFRVGSAIKLANGVVVTGNNQENAVYPSGLCAERVAIFAARSSYPEVIIETIAITCRHEEQHTDKPFTSCGSCRQVMLEYELNQQEPIRILFYGESGEVWEVPNTKVLLPFFFDKSALI